jgi:hypothetical protein
VATDKLCNVEPVVDSPYGADVGHVPEVFIEIQIIPNHKLVGNLKSNVVRSITITLYKKYKTSELNKYKVFKFVRNVLPNQN